MKIPPIISAQNRADNAAAGARLVPIPGSRWKRVVALDIWVRLYTDGEGWNVSFAFTDADLLLPPSEFGLMVQCRVAAARRNTQEARERHGKPSPLRERD